MKSKRYRIHFCVTFLGSLVIHLYMDWSLLVQQPSSLVWRIPLLLFGSICFSWMSYKAVTFGDDWPPDGGPFCFKIHDILTVMKFLIGIDEAGRGPLAGPVAVGAFAVRSTEILRKFKGVKESKQLSHEQREEWFAIIKEYAKRGDVHYAVSFAKPETIDEKGLTLAIYQAINRSLRRLETLNEECRNAEIRLDGLLRASDRYTDQRTIIGGDESEQVIALASICAKVMRDRRMIKAAKEFPGYGFDIHKGYGTKAHYSAIKKLGICPFHRRRFLKNLV